MIIYFARHGESVANVKHIISNHNLDHPLTMEGRQQAVQLADRFANAGLTMVFSSPVPRALETASVICQKLSLPLHTTDALREFDCGVLEGRSGPFAWMRFSRILRHWFKLGRLDKRFKGGESFLDVQKRFEVFIKDLVERFTQENARVLCVTHGGTLHIGLSGLLANLPFGQVIDLPIPYTAVIKLIYENSRFACVEWDGIILPQEH